MINCCNCYRTDGKRNDCYYHIQAMTATLSLEYAAIVVSVLYRMLTTLSLEHENRFNFYDDAQCKFVIEGKGGRENATELEMLQLRVISKTPDCLINKISNEINLKLKKDSGYDSVILRGNHKVFYSKAYLGKKKFVYEIDNSLLPIIEIGNNVN